MNLDMLCARGFDFPLTNFRTMGKDVKQRGYG